MNKGSTSSHREFLIPVAVVLKAARMGVLLPELQYMLLRAARITHPDGNRRFRQWLFDVEGGKLKDIRRLSETELQVEDSRLSAYASQPAAPVLEPHVTLYECETCRDTGKMVVFDQCDRCFGGGCSGCDEGLIRRKVPCPDCSTPPRLGVWG